MANIKSAQKRILVSDKKARENQMINSRMKTYLKKFDAAAALGNIALCESLLPEVSAIVDGACSKGVIHKNNADRKKAAMALKIHGLKTGKITVKQTVEKKTKVKQEVVLVTREERLAKKQALKEEQAKLDKEVKKAAKDKRPTKQEKVEMKTEKKEEKPSRAEKSASEGKKKEEKPAKAEKPAADAKKKK